MTNCCFADANTGGGYPGSYLRMGLGAKAISMGNAGVASPADGYTLFYNPAGLSYLSKKHFALSYSFLSLDRQFHFTGVSIPLKPTAGIAISWIHGGVSGIQGRTSTGIPDQEYTTGENVFILSFANAFHPKLSFGVNFKILQHNLVENTGSGLGFDIGLLFKPIDQIAIGVQLKDIGSGYNWQTEEWFDEKGTNYTEKFPEVIKLGLALKQNSFMFVGDVEMSEHYNTRVHFGGEYTFKNNVMLRSGLNNGDLVFGAGLAYDFVMKIDTKLDYCIVFDSIGNGVTNIFAWEFIF